MPGVAYDPTKQLVIQPVVGLSKIKFACTYWYARPDDTAWQTLEQATSQSTPRPHGPFPIGTEIAYSFSVGGSPGDDWTIALQVTQDDKVLSCSPKSPITGTIDSSGAATTQDTALTLT